MRVILRAIIKGYRFLISPLLGQNCRFHPTCSAYMDEAIERYGSVKGSWMGIKRLCKCHPYHKGDFHDPVP